MTNESCVKFVIFISRHSVESEYVEDEVNLARKYKKSCLVVYLEEIMLSGTLELLLDRWQSINYYEQQEEIFLRMLMKGIPADTIEMKHSASDKDTAFSKKYQLLEVLGKGGSSTVYKAKVLSTGAIVTIKISNCSSKINNTRNQIMKKERDALAKIQCPFIPSIIDFGEEYFDGEYRFYLVESYISGKNLEEIRCPLNEAETLMIILDIAKVLRYLHTDGLNLVHCDIKPGNIIIDQFNTSYLIDFGGCVDAQTTVEWGTNTFAAPEQKSGKAIDVRSDIYSLGITMKYLLEKDFLRLRGITFKENIGKSVMKTTPKVSYILSLIVDKMIAPQIEARFQSLDEVIATLEEYKETITEAPKLILKKNYYYHDDLSVQEKLAALFETTSFKSGKITSFARFDEERLIELQKLFDGESIPREELHHSAVLDLSVSGIGKATDSIESVGVPLTISTLL